MGTDIQDRLKAPKTDQKHHEKVFARLMLQGKVSAALSTPLAGGCVFLPRQDVDAKYDRRRQVILLLHVKI